MNLKIINDDKKFKDALQSLKSYFDKLRKNGVVSSMLIEAYKPLKNAYDIVFNHEIMYGKQQTIATFLPIRNEFVEGAEWLDSEIGMLYQEVLYYFAYNYIVQDDQIGGYNVG